jgi:hypothetical protein
LTAFTGVDSQNLPDVMVSVQFILAIGGSKISKKVYAVILATGLMSFSSVLVETAMNVAFPTLMKQFGLATNFNLPPGHLRYRAAFRCFEKLF